MIVTSTFDISDRVCIDGDTSVRGYVIAIRWTGQDRPEYDVSWMHDGRAEHSIFDEWRLSK